MLPQVRNFFRRADKLLLALSVLSSLYGLIVIASATQTYEGGSAQYVIIQLLAIIIGIIMYVVMTVIDVDIFASQWKWLYALSAALLVALIFFGEGDATTGNNGWLRFAGIGIQPTEFIKLAFIVVLAKQISYLKTYKDLNSFMSVAQIAGHFLLIFGAIIVTADDLGSALVYFFIFALLLFMAGLKIYWFILGLAALAAAVPLLWTQFLSDYQRQRIMAPYDSSIDPDNTGINWQPHQAQIALASGQLTGTGLGEGTQTQSSALPAKHTDFIFAVIGEELGMIGACLCLLLLILIAIRCISVGLNSKDLLSTLVCMGVAGTIVFQTFLNVGMCIGIAPVVGITLPFFSYGGSSVLANFMAMGLVSGVKYRPKPARFTMY